MRVLEANRDVSAGAAEARQADEVFTVTVHLRLGPGALACGTPAATPIAGAGGSRMRVCAVGPPHPAVACQDRRRHDARTAMTRSPWKVSAGDPDSRAVQRKLAPPHCAGMLVQRHGRSPDQTGAPLESARPPASATAVGRVLRDAATLPARWRFVRQGVSERRLQLGAGGGEARVVDRGIGVLKEDLARQTRPAERARVRHAVGRPDSPMRTALISIPKTRVFSSVRELSQSNAARCSSRNSVAIHTTSTGSVPPA
jgi:hypothetical protein